VNENIIMRTLIDFANFERPLIIRPKPNPTGTETTRTRHIEAEIQTSIKEGDSKAQISTSILRNTLKISIDVKIETEVVENTQVSVIKPIVATKKGKFREFEKKPPNIIVTLIRPFNIQSITNKRPKKV
jgi:hypothetical protein